MGSKRGSQDNAHPAITATGESKGLAYAHKDDDYAQGQAAWAATHKYSSGSPVNPIRLRVSIMARALLTVCLV